MTFCASLSSEGSATTTPLNPLPVLVRNILRMLQEPMRPPLPFIESDPQFQRRVDEGARPSAGQHAPWPYLSPG
jgi:hypothetical protein